MKTTIRAALALTLFGASAAYAAAPSNGTYATKTLTVTASIANRCAIQANAALAFGAYDPTSATDLDASQPIGFKCTKGSIFDIGLGGTPGSRSITNGSDTLAYELYSDSGRTQVWGNTQDTDTVDADDLADTTGNGLGAAATAQGKTVYGRVPAGQDKEGGSYTGNVTITIYY
jgi:spore coat protein U-like protein